MGWARHLPLGWSDAKLVLLMMADYSQHPNDSKEWTTGKLKSVRHLVDTQYGVYMAGLDTLVEDTHLAKNTIRNVLKALHAVGVLMPGDPRIGLAYADGRANRAPNVYLFNGAIDSRAKNEWMKAAVLEAMSHINPTRKKVPDYPTLAEAMQAMVPLGNLGFEWVSEDHRTGYWRKVADNEATATQPEPPVVVADPGPEPAATHAVSAPYAAVTLPPGWEPPGEPDNDQPEPEPAAEDNHRIHPKWGGLDPIDEPGRKTPKPGEAAQALAKWWYDQQPTPPVNLDGGRGFIVHNARTAQALLASGYDPDRICQALRTLDHEKPKVETLRSILNGKQRSRGTARATEGIAAVVEGAGTAVIQTDEDRRRKAEKLAILDGRETA